MTIETSAQEYQLLTKTVYSLTDQVALFEMVQDLSQKILSQFDLDNILSTFSQIIQEVIGYNAAAIYLFDESGAFTEKYRSGIGENEMQKSMPEDRMIKWVMEQGRWTMLTDPTESGEKNIYSMLPICTPKQQSGFMIILSDHDKAVYTQKLISILTFAASQTAIAIENQGLYAQVDSARSYLNNMLESISNGILATDMSGNITLINKNATALLGITAQKSKGRHYKEILSPKLGREVEKVFQEIRTKGFVNETMVSHLPYREVKISIGITASLLTDPDRDTIGVIFIFRNMSASKEIERLTRLDAMKNEFVSNVSHELRTPLSIIKSYSEALLSQVEPDDHQTQKNFLSVIDDQTDNLTKIVNNLLDLSRAEAGKYRLDFSSFAFKDLVESVVNGFSKKLSHMTILVNVDKDIPELTADEDKLKEVLVNLVDNAIKFSPNGGIINIEALYKDGEVICSVSDTGIGIPEDQVKKVFEKFYRVDNSDTYEIEGTGLGLSIVKHIVTSHCLVKESGVVAQVDPGVS